GGDGFQRTRARELGAGAREPQHHGDGERGKRHRECDRGALQQVGEETVEHVGGEAALLFAAPAQAGAQVMDGRGGNETARTWAPACAGATGSYFFAGADTG